MIDYTAIADQFLVLHKKEREYREKLRGEIDEIQKKINGSFEIDFYKVLYKPEYGEYPKYLAKLIDAVRVKQETEEKQ
jgi:hypothetical protein